MPKFLQYFFFAFLLYFSSAHAADIKSIGVPYIENYPKSVYASGNQNWSIAKDKNGIMYFGNGEGLLTFDGRYWQEYQMPNRQIVRAVAADNKGRVYVGCFGDFGYWAIKDGKQAYTSLTRLLPKGETVTDEIWKIYLDKDRIIFSIFFPYFYLSAQQDSGH